MPTNRYWTRSAQPLGAWPEPDTFELRESPMPVPGAGQALTRTIYISLDPYQWGYKRRGTEAPGTPCHARTVAQVIESRMEGFAAGDFVFNTNGWAEYGLMGEGVARPSYMIPRKLDPSKGLLKAFVALNPGYRESEELRKELLAHARKRLGPAVAPREIDFRPSLPKTRSGKIMRRLLKARELGLPEGDISTLEGSQ